MVISTNNISLSSIQKEFGGINPIRISEYYRNSVTNYTTNILSLPTINNPISFNMFSDLAKDINILYTTPGSYTYTVPAGIKSLCVLCVGGGAAGAYNQFGSAAGGGGGGGLIWVNKIIVTEGQRFNIIVGAGGNGSNSSNLGGQDGNASSFIHESLPFTIRANGGISGGSTRLGGACVYVNFQSFTAGTKGTNNGGDGGASINNFGLVYGGGGGGAAGYTGNGGRGGTNNSIGNSGIGGGGAGGKSSSSNNSQGGGGVGILNGQGSSGTGDIGGGGSEGQTGRYMNVYASMAGGVYGGGGAGNVSTIYPFINRSGGNGAVRIMALGKNSNRSLPANAFAF
jgi:hypothetical protein